MTAAIMFAIAFAASAAAIIGIAPRRKPRTPDAVDYAEQEERLMRAAAKAREEKQR